jgi:hypothetical protein
MQVTQYEFCKTIADDYGIEINEKQITKMSQFPIKNGKRKVKSFYDAIIVDTKGNEYPYMIDMHTRNNERLIDFDYIYITRSKRLNKIISEAGITLKSESVRIRVS